MKTLKKKDWLGRQEIRSFSLLAVLLFALFTGTLRGTLEGLLFSPDAFNVSLILSYSPFYFFMYSLIVLFLEKIIRGNPDRIRNAALPGMFLGIFPPLLDILMSAWQPVSDITYGYYLDLFLENNWVKGFWFFYAPANRLPLGESITLWLLIFFGGWYTLRRTGDFARSLLAILVIYCIIFLNAYIFPSLLKFVYAKWAAGSNALGQMDYKLSLMHVLLATLVWLFREPDSSYRLLKRAIHIFPFLAATFLGSRIAGLPFSTELTSGLILIYLVFTALLAQNDLHDTLEDSSQSRKITISKDTILILNCAVTYIIVNSFAHEQSIAIPLLLIFITGVLYNYPFYRAKRYMYGTMKIEGIWGFSAVLAGGVILAKPETFGKLVFFGFLAFLGWSFFALLKDAKDIRGDRHAQNLTYYVLAFKRGIRLKHAHRALVGLAVVFLCIPSIYSISTANLVQAGALLIPVLFLLAASFMKITYNWFRVLLVIFSLNIILIAFLLV